MINSILTDGQTDGWTDRQKINGRHTPCFFLSLWRTLYKDSIIESEVEGEPPNLSKSFSLLFLFLLHPPKQVLCTGADTFYSYVRLCCSWPMTALRQMHSRKRHCKSNCHKAARAFPWKQCPAERWQEGSYCDCTVLCASKTIGSHTAELVLAGGRCVLVIVQKEKWGLPEALCLDHMTRKGLWP